MRIVHVCRGAESKTKVEGTEAGRAEEENTIEDAKVEVASSPSFFCKAACST